MLQPDVAGPISATGAMKQPDSITANVVNNTLAANSNGSQNVDTGGIPTDFVANGFKCRGTGGDFNGNGETYIFLAFAESPFKYARAR